MNIDKSTQDDYYYSQISSYRAAMLGGSWLRSIYVQLRQYHVLWGGWSEFNLLSQQVWQYAYQQYSHSSSLSKSSFLPQTQQGQSKGSSKSSFGTTSSTFITRLPFIIEVQGARQQGHLVANLLLSKIQVKQKRCPQCSLPIDFTSAFLRSHRQIEHSIVVSSFFQSFTLFGTVASLLSFFLRHSALVTFFTKTNELESSCSSDSFFTPLQLSQSLLNCTASFFTLYSKGTQTLFLYLIALSNVKLEVMLFLGGGRRGWESSSISLYESQFGSRLMVLDGVMSLKRGWYIIINYEI